MINGVPSNPLPAPVVPAAAVSIQTDAPATGQSSVAGNLTAMLQSLAGDAGGLNETVLAKLNELAKILADRSNLLFEMPDTVQQQARTLMRQTAVTPKTVSEGMSAVFQQQKHAARQLLELSAKLEESARWPSDAPISLPTLAKQTTKLLPGQAAQLARLLADTAQELVQPQGTMEQATVDKATVMLQKTLELLKPRLTASANDQPPTAKQQLTHPGTAQAVPTPSASVYQAELRPGSSQPVPTPSASVYQAELRPGSSQTSMLLSSREAVPQMILADPADLLGEGQPVTRGQQVMAQPAGQQDQQAAKQEASVYQEVTQKSMPGVASSPNDIQKPGSQAVRQQAMQSDSASTLNQPAAFVSPTSRSLTLLMRELTAALMPSSPPADIDSSAEQPPKLPAVPIRLLENMMPSALRQLIGSESTETLPVLWSLLKAQELSEWQGLEPQERTKAATALRKLAHSLLREEAPQGESRTTHTALSCSLPLYFGDNPTPYPAYIHLYHQQEGQESGAERHFETWLRIVLQTEHVGPADVVFRLYDSKILDIRMGIGNTAAAQELSQAIPEIRTALEGTPLEIRQVTAVPIKY